MSDKVQFEQSFKVTAPTEQVATAWAEQHLRARGYSIFPPGEKWEALGNFMQRIGISNYSSITRSIKYWIARGENLPIRRTASGRVIELLSNPAFDEFCQRNKS